MEYLGVRYEAKHLPELDPQFVPFGVWMNAYRVGAPHFSLFQLQLSLASSFMDSMFLFMLYSF